MTEHKNDMYGNIESRSEADAGVQAPIPAATVVLLRDGDGGIEVLMPPIMPMPVMITLLP